MSARLPLWPLLRVAAHLLSGLAQCALLFPWLPLGRRNRLVQRWSRQLIGIFGIALAVDGVRAGAAGGDLRGAGAVVANHVSWIDVFVLNAIAPCRFVAKAEVRRWPAIGWLSARAGTLYIARHKRSDLVGANATMAAHLAAGERLALFPEGTSAAQGELLPFHANLFQGIAQAGASVLPTAIAYVDASGKASSAADYIGDMSLWQSMLSLLTQGPLLARVALLAPIDGSAGERRALATATHAAIGAALVRLLETDAADAMP